WALDGTVLRQIANPTPVANDSFGQAVAVWGSYAVIGVPRNDSGANDVGIAYVFNVMTGQLLWTLTNPSPAVGDQVGASVAIANGLIAVSAPFHDEAGVTNSGAVYLFDLRTGALRNTLLNPASPASAADDNFGLSLAMFGDLLAVGAPGNNESGVA